MENEEIEENEKKKEEKNVIEFQMKTDCLAARNGNVSLENIFAYSRKPNEREKRVMKMTK